MENTEYLQRRLEVHLEVLAKHFGFSVEDIKKLGKDELVKMVQGRAEALLSCRSGDLFMLIMLKTVYRKRKKDDDKYPVYIWFPKFDCSSFFQMCKDIFFKRKGYYRYMIPWPLLCRQFLSLLSHIKRRVKT